MHFKTISEERTFWGEPTLCINGSQTFWFQEPFVLLKIVEGPKELLIYVGYIY